MANALIIKNVDFSVNKLTTVTIEQDVPCTGISLNKSTAAITHLGDTDTLTATVTPSNTTDSIIWSSSDQDVCTVTGGVVTATGCGTATITATCGSYSATCAVTVTHVAAVVYSIDRYFGKNDSRSYLEGGALSNYAIGYSTNGTKRISSASDDAGRFPFVIPAGATQISITNASAFKPYGFWLNSLEGAPGWSSVALAYPKDAFGTGLSDYGDRTVTIPDRTTGDYAGMDAVGFVFKYNGTITQEATDAIVVTFS